jgi:hypothetical protein
MLGNAVDPKIECGACDRSGRARKSQVVRSGAGWRKGDLGCATGSWVYLDFETDLHLLEIDLIQSAIQAREEIVLRK